MDTHSNRSSETSTSTTSIGAGHGRPAWTERAQRIDRPQLDHWYKPESGPLDGILLWHGDDVYDGKPFHMFVVREHGTGLQLGVRERAGLRALRSTKLGSRVFIEPQGKKDLGGDRAMWEFAIFAEDVAAGGGPDAGAGDAGGDDIPF